MLSGAKHTEPQQLQQDKLQLLRLILQLLSCVRAVFPFAFMGVILLAAAVVLNFIIVVPIFIIVPILCSSAITLCQNKMSAIALARVDDERERRIAEVRAEEQREVSTSSVGWLADWLAVRIESGHCWVVANHPSIFCLDPAVRSFILSVFRPSSI